MLILKTNLEVPIESTNGCVKENGSGKFFSGVLKYFSQTHTFFTRNTWFHTGGMN